MQSYGSALQTRLRSLGISEVLTAARSPWQSPYVERLIASIRRECLNHVVVLNAHHLKRVLSTYFDDYHTSRTHLGLGKDRPEHRPIHPPRCGNIVALPQVGGLHLKYIRRAA